jgi:hypothetical protein
MCPNEQQQNYVHRCSYRKTKIDILVLCDMEGIGLHVEVTDFQVQNSGQNFCDHVWTVKVTVDGKDWLVARSFNAFSYIDQSLRKRYFQLDIPELPLPESDSLNKSLEKQQKEKDKEDMEIAASQGPKEAWVSPHKRLRRASIIPVAIKGVSDLEGKEEALTEYLHQIIDNPVLLSSPDILSFLEPDISNGIGEPTDKVSLHDYILRTTDPLTVSVKAGGKEDIQFQTTEKETFFWQFTTDNYDIGFTVDFNGEVVVPLTRYNSHLSKVEGSYYCRETGLLSLRFDNSYARMRSKKVSYKTVNVSEILLQGAEESVVVREIERRQIDKQRELLRYRAGSIGVEKSGINLVLTTPLEEKLLQEERTLMGLERQIKNLESGKKAVEDSLMTTEKHLTEEKMITDELNGKLGTTRAKIQELEKLHVEKDTAAAALKVKTDANTAQLEAKIKSLESRLAEETAFSKAKVEENTNLKETIEQLETDLASARTNIEEQDTKNKFLLGNIAERDKTIYKQNNILLEGEDLVKNLKVQTEQMQKSLSDQAEQMQKSLSDQAEQMQLNLAVSLSQLGDKLTERASSSKTDN